MTDADVLAAALRRRISGTDDEIRRLAESLAADGPLADRLAAADTLLDALTGLVDAVERGDHLLPPALNRARLLLGTDR
jgi:hypothetical protein